MKIPIISSLLENGMLTTMNEKIQNPETQRRLVLVIVCIALLLDNMLYMVIVPIIPIYLDELKVEEIAEEAVQTPALQLQQQQLQTQLQQQPIRQKFPKHSRRRKTTTLPPDLMYGNYTNYTSSNDDSIVAGPIPLLVKYTGDKSTDSRVGILFASKALVQLFISPISGTVIDRIGYETPMIIGLSIIFLSTTIFAFGRSYAVLFIARSLQGVGSAFADTSGLAMIADRYKEEAARSKAQGIALAFISFGCLFAPPFGGFFYTYAGKAVPFLMLSLIALIDGIMLRFVMKPVRKEHAEHPERKKLKGTPIYKLILDPYIAICAGALVMANVSLAFLEPTIARWMKETMKSNEFQIGAVWLPAFIPHVFGVYLTVKLAKLFPKHQWLITAIGLTMEGLSCLIIPFCSNFGMVILPLMIDCFGIALVDTAILPTLAYLVDVRHVSVYGSVYAIADISYSLAYAFGPIVADSIYQNIGFFWLNIGICLSNVLYAPLLYALKNVYKYTEFKNEDDDQLDYSGYPEGKPITSGAAPVADQQYMTYKMTSLPVENGDGKFQISYASAIPSQNYLAPQLQQPPAQPQQYHDDYKQDDRINRQYVKVGRTYSKDSSDDAAEYKSYH